MVITDSEWDAGASLWNTALVGYPIGRRISFKDMTKFIHNWWRDAEIPKINRLQNGIFVFTSKSEEAMMKILQKRWNFFGSPLILQKWSPEIDMNSMNV